MWYCRIWPKIDMYGYLGAGRLAQVRGCLMRDANDALRKLKSAGQGEQKVIYRSCRRSRFRAYRWMLERIAAADEGWWGPGSSLTGEVADMAGRLLGPLDG